MMYLKFWISFTFIAVLQTKCEEELKENEEIYDYVTEISNEFGNDSLPFFVDWRKSGVITSLIDEREYFSGYSWAFAAVSAVESQLLIGKKKQFKPLSAQNLIDCIPFDINNQLNNLSFAFNYLLNGVLTAEQYPYKAGKGKCDRTGNQTKNAVMVDFYISVANEDHMKAIIASDGPVSTIIDASRLKNYTSGIITSEMCGNTINDLNHAVLVIGYGNETGTDYWIVKNSWGPSWGEQGYGRIQRNSNNTCGIALPYLSIFPGINRNKSHSDIL